MLASLPVQKKTQLSISRWGRVLFYLLVCSVAFDLVLPVAWRFAQNVSAPYTTTAKEFIFWFGVFLLFLLVAEPIRIPRRQISGWPRYPPLWLAVPCALLLVGTREAYFPYLGLWRWAVEPDWPHSIPLGWIALVLAVVAICVRQLRFRVPVGPKSPETGPSRDNVTPSHVKEWIDAGERPLESHEPDFLGHQMLADRIARKVAECGGSPVALLGVRGSGKSSILNAVCGELDRSSPPVVVARVDVWTVPKPEDVPRLALNQIIVALHALADTTDLRGLPRSYKRLSHAEPSGRLARALREDRSADSLEALERLMPILVAFDARIVLMVEDIERAGPAFDPRHLHRFLWAFRQLDRCSFVVAVDTDTKFDLLKVCDTIELVPAVNTKRVANVIMAAYDHWNSAYSYINSLPDESISDKFLFKQTNPDKLEIMTKESGTRYPLEALSSLVETPRLLKHVLRRADQAWSNLHGEAEFDDIVILSALRGGAPEAFLFLLEHIDVIRSDPIELRPGTMTVTKNWKNVMDEVPNGASAEQLVRLLGIGQLAGRPDVDSVPSPQGVAVDEPVDYFSRIVAERLAPSELRDQVVLQHIEEWKIGRGDQLLDRLVSATDTSDHYVGVFCNLSGRLIRSRFIELTKEVVSRAISSYGPSLPASHPAIMGLRHKCYQRLSSEEFAELTANLISLAISGSLYLAAEFIFYWAESVYPGAKPTTYESVRKAIQTQLSSPQNLVSVLAKEHPFAVYNFIVYTEKLGLTEPLQKWRDCFAPLLIEGARLDPDLVVPQIAMLSFEFQSRPIKTSAGHLRMEDQPTFDRERMRVFFQDQVDQALTILAKYKGTDPRAVLARKHAMSWMRERASRGAES